MNDGLFNENGYKKYVIIFLIIFVILTGFIIFLVVRNNQRGYLIINESFILSKKGNKYVQLEKIEDNIFDEVYNVYNGDLYHDITIKYDLNNWYYFDKNYKDLNLNKVSVAYTNYFSDLKVADYDVSYYDEEDDDFIKEIVNSDDFEKYKKSIIKSKFDIDSDGKEEVIYTLTDVELGNESKDSFSAIFLVKDGKVLKIADDSKPYYVQAIIDLDGNGKYEIIVSNGTSDFATMDTCYQIYSIAHNRVKKIKGC